MRWRRFTRKCFSTRRLNRRYYRASDIQVKLDSPEKALLAAIVSRAIQDVYMINCHSCENRVKNSREAAKWFKDTSLEDWSFRWVCQQLGYDKSLTTEIARKVLSGELADFIYYYNYNMK